MAIAIVVPTLIRLVHNQPILWDRNNEEYKNQQLGKLAWKEICRELNADYDRLSEDEKPEFVKEVIKKWNHLRDNYSRYLKKRDICVAGDGVSKRTRRYIYAKQLKFLNKLYNVESSEDSEDQVDQDESNVAPSAEEESASDTNAPRRQIKACTTRVITFPSTNAFEDVNVNERHHSAEEASVSDTIARRTRMKVKTIRTERVNTFPTSSTNPLEDSDDRHVSFFKSILPSLRNFNDDEILQFQMSVLQVVKDIKKPPQYTFVPSYPLSSTGSHQIGVGMIYPQRSSSAAQQPTTGTGSKRKRGEQSTSPATHTESISTQGHNLRKVRRGSPKSFTSDLSNQSFTSADFNF